jgi:hypothetical protein
MWVMAERHAVVSRLDRSHRARRNLLQENTMSASPLAFPISPARILLAASTAALALALGGALQPASAVECDNVGVGGNTANDLGVASNTACGDAAAAASTRSTAIGIDANSGGDSSVAIGDSANSDFPGSIAIGQNTTAVSVNAIAIGNDGADVDAIGSTASGINSLAVGTDATATSNDTIAIGTESFSGSPGTTAIGRNSIAQSPGATALGEQAIAGGNETTAIGAGAFANFPDSVALGSESEADRPNAVSVGNDVDQRQITNVAPGTAGTDAVNVDQLDVALAAIADLEAQIAALQIAALVDHTHIYRTAKGKKHKKRRAKTGGPLLSVGAPTSTASSEPAASFSSWWEFVRSR